MPQPRKTSCRLSTLARQVALAPQSSEAQDFTIEPSKNCTLGAVVKGLRLNDGLSPEAERRIKEAFLEHKLLIFEDQTDLSLEQQVAVGKIFGKIEFEKLAISNQRNKETGKLAPTLEEADGELLKPDHPSFSVVTLNQAWHMDSTYLNQSAKAGLLFAQKVPSWGGETEWADMQSAYEVLPAEKKAQLEDMVAWHSAQYSVARRCGIFPKSKDGSGKAYGQDGMAKLRPLVKTHPETGKKNIFIASHAFGIPGMTTTESTKFLDEIVEDACQGPRVFQHKWKVGDFALWDNRSVLHRARPYDAANEPRIMRATRVAGDEETETCLPTEHGSQVLHEELEILKTQPRWTYEESKNHPR